MTVFKNVASGVVVVLLSADPRCIDFTRQPRCAGRSPVLLWVAGPQEPVASPSGRGQKLTARVRTFVCLFQSCCFGGIFAFLCLYFVTVPSGFGCDQFTNSVGLGRRPSPQTRRKVTR